MKICPQCQTQYTDDTLVYCLQDGTRLGNSSSAAPDETETVISRRSNSPEQQSQVTQWRQSDVTNVSSLQPSPKSGRTLALLITAILIVILLGGLGIGTWVYLSRARQDEVAKNSNGPANRLLVNSSNSTFNGSNLPSPTPTVKSVSNTFAPDNKTNTSNAPDNGRGTDAEIRKEVQDRIYSWKSMAEARDINSYMSNYASTVDYYRKNTVSRDFVRNDKMRAFSAFNSISINLSDITISPDPSGQSATATFDKEWVFLGNRRSTGKVRSQLQLSKINGTWLITSEKDLKIYYTG
jgi:hypothetical protein